MSRLHRGRQALKSALSESGFRYPMIDYVGPDPVLIMAGRSGQRGRGMPVPDLKGAWIARVRWQEDRLVLTLDGVRHRGLLFAGDVTFEGVGKVEGSDPRLTSGALVLTAGMTIRAQESRPGETMLDLLRQTGPGDADEPPSSSLTET